MKGFASCLTAFSAVKMHDAVRLDCHTVVVWVDAGRMLTATEATGHTTQGTQTAVLPTRPETVMAAAIFSRFDTHTAHTV